MSTRSNVGVVNDDGSVTVVYVHFDGYPSGVGRTLEKDHNSREAAIDLVSHGAIRAICNGVQYFNDEETNQTYPSKDDYLKVVFDNIWIEFVYLWENGQWRCKAPRSQNGFMCIEDAVRHYETGV